MLRDADLSHLVDLIYAAATDASRWPTFLDRLKGALDARIVALAAYDTRTKVGAFSFNLGVPPDYIRLYNDYYSERNVWMMYGREHNQPGNVRTSEERYPASELVKTEFYSDFLRPVGVRHGVGGTILKDGSQIGNITALRAKDRYGDDARRVLSALIPHLRRAIRTYRRLAGTRIEEHAVLASLDRLPCGVLLVDHAAQPLFINTEARRIIATRDGFSLDRGTLTAARPGDTRTLQGLVTRAAAAGGGGGFVALGRPSGRRAFGIEIVPLALPATHGLSPRVVGLVVVDPDRQHENDERVLARVYALTPAEAALAARLAGGDSLADAAAHRQIGHETARTHLKRILRKTGVRRQAELVLRLRQGPLSMAAGAGRGESA